jgi:SAM-dependent methyltransferase
MPVTREEVIWSYRTILGREPESEDVVTIHLKSRDFPSLRESFLRSPDFIGNRDIATALPGIASLPMDLPKNEIEFDASMTQISQCLEKIKSAWSHLGITRPYFSVLTDRNFLPENFKDNADRFWASGEREADDVERILTGIGFVDLPTKNCVEYGCGVGRVTTGLARRFGRVDAYDISQGHLTQAELHAQAVGAENICYHLCAEDVLEELTPCDFLYTKLVLQHNPPPIIVQLVKRALRSLNADGIGIFQVPTYQVGYHFRIDEWLAAEAPLDMQMHCLPQEVLFAIIVEEHCTLLSVREDNAIGEPDRFISNTFVVRKSPSAPAITQCSDALTSEPSGYLSKYDDIHSVSLRPDRMA